MLTQEAAMKLTQACQREDLEIVSVDTDYRHKRHLENLSILKGEVVTCLCNRTGDVVIKVKDGRIAINREFAEKIEVESLNPQYFHVVEKNVGFGKGRHKVEIRKPTPEAVEVFRKEDAEMAKQEKEAKEKLKSLREEKKRDLGRKDHD